MECAEAGGCTIRKTIGKNGDKLMRGCSAEKDVVCDTIDNGEDEGVSIKASLDNVYPTLCTLDNTVLQL